LQIEIAKCLIKLGRVKESCEYLIEKYQPIEEEMPLYQAEKAILTC